MTNPRQLTTTLLLALLFAVAGTPTLADETTPTADKNPTAALDKALSPSREIEEIIVYSRRRGAPADPEATLEENLRNEMLKDLDRLAEERKSGTARTIDGPSGVKLGYDPEEDKVWERDTASTDLPIDEVKPATVIKIGF